ncbi:phage integrase Arm DNA-binding domain-containing protein [Methylomonas montana]|uniref:phage integrase Arm DNA-binding domain-containing protein n=1 Tax=Methylomonas montana TaxID=3058963 RepID=UPI00265A90C5|nr:phage integrase Arm DNA-binding domain-containing protein [Methylomonas montana]WKJ88795.1 phage integrase Arm DNA-binding domain-containing protein [Methylomonas montana]
MAPRKRSGENRDLNKIPNLYRKLDKRTNKASFQYKDPRDGTFYGMGTDEEIAKIKAKQLNAAIYAQLAQSDTDRIMAQHPAVKQYGIAFEKWIAEYLRITDERLSTGDIKPNTHRIRAHLAARLGEMFKGKGIQSISVKDIAQGLKAYHDQGKARMAQSLRSTLIDIFAEAIQAGEIENNPASMTKNKPAVVKRSRLTYDEWSKIFLAAEDLNPWVQNSMLLALLTGQRLEDIALARFKKSADWGPALIAYRKRENHPIKPYAFIESDFLHVPQQKTGTLLRIPLDLRLDCLKLSVGDVVSRCRRHAVSQYLIHHTQNGFKQSVGDPVHLNTVSKGFAKARGKSGLTWDGKTPPTFHEQRSLAERLYREQGLNTQTLLGHKSQKMTDVYHDVRGAEWLDVVTK